jgi:hypothetical protein
VNDFAEAPGPAKWPEEGASEEFAEVEGLDTDDDEKDLAPGDAAGMLRFATRGWLIAAAGEDCSTALRFSATC